MSWLRRAQQAVAPDAQGTESDVRPPEAVAHAGDAGEVGQERGSGEVGQERGSGEGGAAAAALHGAQALRPVDGGLLAEDGPTADDRLPAEDGPTAGDRLPAAAGPADERPADDAVTQDAKGTKGSKRPLYPRLLRLRHVHPNGWQRALLGEGALAVAALLVLADVATAWTLLVLPLAVALVVKSHDALAGVLARRGGSAGPHASTTTEDDPVPVAPAEADAGDLVEGRPAAEGDRPTAAPSSRPLAPRRRGRSVSASSVRDAG